MFSERIVDGKDIHAEDAENRIYELWDEWKE